QLTTSSSCACLRCNRTNIPVLIYHHHNNGFCRDCILATFQEGVPTPEEKATVYQKRRAAMKLEHARYKLVHKKKKQKLAQEKKELKKALCGTNKTKTNEEEGTLSDIPNTT